MNRCIFGVLDFAVCFDVRLCSVCVSTGLSFSCWLVIQLILMCMLDTIVHGLRRKYSFKIS